MLAASLALGGCAPHGRPPPEAGEARRPLLEGAVVRERTARRPTAAPPAEDEEGDAHALEGMATWYGPGFAGHRTANGERFDPSRLTAAHRTLPFGTKVRVVSLRTGASVVVRINDRGPFGRSDRIIDLSRGAARRIGLDRAGVMRVRLEVVVPLGGSAPEPRERAPAE